MLKLLLNPFFFGRKSHRSFLSHMPDFFVCVKDSLDHDLFDLPSNTSTAKMMINLNPLHQALERGADLRGSRMEVSNYR